MGSAKPLHVFLFEDDLQRMKDWVLQYPDIETGGQFFGLFTYTKCPYIHIVIGPGKDCRHESHSFHQDIPYLENVGKYLNEEFMMCHIGEWHSHHKLRLRQPSHGDVRSVLNNFPEGVEYFILVIATIEDGAVKLWPWLFDGTTKKHEAIDLEIIHRENVFMKDEDIVKRIETGAEIPPNERIPWFSTDKGTTLVQFLNSELEKIADKRKVEITSSHQKHLSFSFQRNRCAYIVEFPDKFSPRKGNITCKPPNCSQASQMSVSMKQGAEPEEFVEKIVNNLRKMNVQAPF